MAKIKKDKRTGFNKKELKQMILDLCYSDPQKTYTYKQFSSVFNLKDISSQQLISVSALELVDDGYLSEEERGKFKIKERAGYITGIVDLTMKGFGYIISEESEEDVFVSAPNLKNAMNGDKVKVYLHAQRKKKQPEGEVVEILERAKTNFVGTIEIAKNFAFLVPTGRNNFDIFIPKEKLKGAKHGEKAIARITEWPPKARNPFGEIIDVLGVAGDNNTEMHAILAEYELPYKFPERVEAAADKLVIEITDDEIAKRRDCRGIPTFTIDPADAKDFDDALSIQKLENNLWEVGVHIADVSHYVQPESIIDQEAYDRGTSVYLVDRVVPMLPEMLSNGVCSLRPNEDKLCYSAIFEIDDHSVVKNRWFGRTIIHSDRRFSYEEAQNVIETGDGDMKSEILTLDRLAKQLCKKRFEGGAISFERAEVKFILDENSKPIGVYFKEAKDSNKLIEEFMLLANREVAEFIGKQKDKKQEKTFVYRIHDRPDPEKLDKFNNFIHKFGYGIQMQSPDSISKSINRLLENVKGKGEENVVGTLAIRAMAKAVYSTRNIGHYGLAFEYYTHFTSPIRRYPDLMVHRLLDRYLNSGRSVNALQFEDKCKHTSGMEQRAANAERASIKYKQVEFMQDKIGEVFDGVISGVTDWGLYVELEESKCEGMISIRDLVDDFYFFDEKNYCISGMHSKKNYQLGDKIQIKVVKANLEKKQLDFKLATDDSEVSVTSRPPKPAKEKKNKYRKK